MHWLLLAYIIIFSVLLIFNSYFWVINKGKIHILLYELITGFYLIFIVCLYVYPVLIKTVGIWPILPVPAVLASECYFSVWGNLDDLIPENQKAGRPELEAARGFSILFSSPAYLIAAKLFIDNFF